MGENNEPLQNSADNNFYSSVILKWKEGSQAFQTLGFELPKTKLLKSKYQERMFDLALNYPNSIPYTFVEIGGGVEPIVSPATVEIARQTKHVPEVFLYDPGYFKDYDRLTTKLRFLTSPLSTKEVPEISIDSEETIDQILGQSINLHIHSEAIPNVSIPVEIDSYHLVFASLANYVDKEDLKKILSDPRVASVAFVNSISAGQENETTRSLLHPNRIQSSYELSEMCRNAGLILVDNLTDEDDSNQSPEPAVAEFYIRTQGKLELEKWLHNK